MIERLIRNVLIPIRMAKVLVVEDSKIWQDLHKDILEEILGQDTIDIAANYSTALALLESNVYDMYILDGEFPRESGDPQPLGISLAKHIAENFREGSYEHIRIVTGRDSTLDEAQALGIIAYTKGNADKEKGYKDFYQLEEDVKDILGL